MIAVVFALFSCTMSLFAELLNPAMIALGETGCFHARIDGFDNSQQAQLVWSVRRGGIQFEGENSGEFVTLRGTAVGEFELAVELMIDGKSLLSIPYVGHVEQKSIVNYRLFVVCDSDGTPAPVSLQFAALIAETNDLFKQAAIEFRQVGQITYVTNSSWYNIVDRQTRIQLQSIAIGTGALEIYCVNTLYGNVVGVNTSSAGTGPGPASAGLTLSSLANGRTLSHELGHACGLPDIYVQKTDQSGTVSATLEDDKPTKEWLVHDWGVYNSECKHRDLVQRLLMYGVYSETKGDIPTGAVYGVNRSCQKGLVSVGIMSMNRNPVH